MFLLSSMGCAAVVAPLRSFFAIVSATGQTALDFCDPFIATWGLCFPV